MRGVEDSIFLSTEKLHLTITTFVLLDDFEIENAVKMLQDCKTDIIEWVHNENILIFFIN